MTDGSYAAVRRRYGLFKATAAATHQASGVLLPNREVWVQSGLGQQHARLLGSRHSGQRHMRPTQPPCHCITGSTGRQRLWRHWVPESSVRSSLRFAIASPLEIGKSYDYFVYQIGPNDPNPAGKQQAVKLALAAAVAAAVPLYPGPPAGGHHMHAATAHRDR